ncbi:MAG: hypothetical protein RRZ84_09430, partial [Romboutsia sp.]
MLSLWFIFTIGLVEQCRCRTNGINREPIIKSANGQKSFSHNPNTLILETLNNSIDMDVSKAYT